MTRSQQAAREMYDAFSRAGIPTEVCLKIEDYVDAAIAEAREATESRMSNEIYAVAMAGK